MKLIEEIRNEITNSRFDLSSTLRKSKILASILDNDQLKNWVNSELSGYKNLEELPDYRIISIQSFGYFTGPFNSSVNNVPLPTVNLSKTLKDMAVEIKFNDGVRQIETLITNTKGESLKQVWPAEAVILAREHIQMSGGLVLAYAWKHINVSSLENILDQVRNRLLDFILELQDIDSEILVSNDAIKSIPQEKVNNIFNYTIYGNSNVVASGSGITQTIHQQINHGDFEALKKYLESLKIEQNDINSLEEIIDDDDHEDYSFGEKVKSWVGQMTYKAIEGVWKMSVETAPQLLNQAIKSYYGWE